MDLQFDADTQRRFLQGRQAGIPDELNMRRAVAFQATKAKQGMQGNIPTVKAHGQNIQGKKSSSALDLLPLIGAVGGSFIPGAGTIVGGALGAGLGTLLKQGLKGEDFNAGEVAKETVLSGAGGVAGKGLGFLGGKIAGKLGGGLVGLSDDIAIKGLRLNKSQLVGFAEKHGEDVSSFLAKEGAVGKNAAKLTAEHIEPLQNSFNQITKNSGLRFKPDTFLKNLDDQAEQLIKAGGSENRALAEKIRQEGLFILQHDLAPAGNSVEKANKLRQTFAGKVNWMDPEKSVVNTGLSRALRQTNIETAEAAGLADLGEIGKKLGKFRDLEDIVKAQEQLGRGSLPAGITKWLAFGAGASGGPGGVVATVAANQVVNSPRFLGAAARGTRAAGERLGGIQPGSQLLQRMGIGAGPTSQLFTGGPQQEQQSIDQTMQPPTDMGQGAPQMQSGQDQQQEQLKQVIGAFMLQNAKSISDLKTAYEFMQPSGAGGTDGVGSADKVKLQVNAQSGLQAIQTLEQELAKDSFAPFKAKIPILKQQTPYVAAAKEIADVYTRIRTGAALNEQEQVFYDSQLPQPFDSPETILYKIGLFKNLFQEVNNKFGMQQGGTQDVLQMFAQ